MPIGHARLDETREMRLISQLLAMKKNVKDRSVPEFIARRRTPGDGWRTWDQISFELREVLGEIVTDGTLRKWAACYGIPERTRADGTGEVTADEFAKALAAADIEVAD
jgi:hypothetical protein